MTLRPLPRSLDPLEDETLVGFILRLASHNGTTRSKSQPVWD